MRSTALPWRGIVVQADAPSRTLELPVGATARFGRDAGADIVLAGADAGVSRLAGTVTATEDHWLLTNLSHRSTYVVENPEGGGEFVKAAPLRLDMPVPFEFARVVVPGTVRPAAFLVFAPQHAYAERSAHQPAGDPTRTAFPLDENAKYFLVLVALCEPRLRDTTSPVVRTVPEILDRLAGAPGAAGLTRTSVNFHIDYLARVKLRVKPPAPAGKADWQRAALISLALRFDLVRPEHLALLGPAGAQVRAGAGSTAR
ncbi:serine/threonine protein kinase [Symbioplanes lichenis]|uniref:serine/threonine protein kinase n=1 Tax=Symbioplanes lichenis TaxID=1629072 RepID=UPI002738ACC6|nr:serine/threonine protein kinase [Actinoplanes lichenis]